METMPTKPKARQNPMKTTEYDRGTPLTSIRFGLLIISEGIVLVAIAGKIS